MRLTDFLDRYELSGVQFAARVTVHQGVGLSKQHLSNLAVGRPGIVASPVVAAAIVRESEAVAREQGGSEWVSLDELPLAEGTRAVIDLVRGEHRTAPSCCGCCEGDAVGGAAA